MPMETLDRNLNVSINSKPIMARAEKLVPQLSMIKSGCREFSP